MISVSPTRSSSVSKTLASLEKKGTQIGRSKDKALFFLKGRDFLMGQRQKREKIAREKLILARTVAERLKIIPTVKLVGLTGRLAMRNVDPEDDIDLLIITASSRLWLTRLLAVALLECLGKRRRPQDQDVKNKICLNMFLDEDQLALPSQERNLYTAHEVVQMKPLWGKDQTHNRFLKANQWVKQYLANALGNSPRAKEAQTKKGITRGPINLLETLARRFQLSYMSRRRTTEVATPHRALFHPQSAQDWVLKEYRRRLSKYGLRAKTKTR